MPMTPKEFAKLLMQNGFEKRKSNGGSHQKYFHPKTKVSITLPMHSKEMKKGLEQALLKQAGLKQQPDCKEV